MRRRALEQRLAVLRREEQRAAAEAAREEQVRDLVNRIEAFRAALATGLERATFDQRRALVEMLVDRVVVDAPDVEIRYVIPLTGLARRNGALRPHHRELAPTDTATRARAPALHIAGARPAVPRALRPDLRPLPPRRPRLPAPTYRQLLQTRFATWRETTGLAAA